jgi:hypothetical protein
MSRLGRVVVASATHERHPGHQQLILSFFGNLWGKTTKHFPHRKSLPKTTVRALEVQIQGTLPVKPARQTAQRSATAAATFQAATAPLRQAANKRDRGKKTRGDCAFGYNITIFSTEPNSRRVFQITPL